MGFLNKQSGMRTLAYCLHEKLINEDQYRYLYQKISESNLAQNELSQQVNGRDELILMRIVHMFVESKKGVRFAAFYEPCDTEEPIVMSKTLSEIAKTS
jgi:hypothetical protein